MEYVLTAEKLCKSYGKCNALNDLSLHIPKGAIYGLIGKNGAGKTTLIRIICGLQRPDSGSYTIFSASSSNEKALRKARRRTGSIIESPAIYKNMSAKDNLKMQCTSLGLPSFDIVDELLELVGLSDTGRKYAGNFSLGMRQRLAIAIALCGDPDFLILDEPTNGLDPQGIIEIRELILKLNRERSVTVLISSHFLDELSRIATHYGFADKGKIVKEISAEAWAQTQKKCVSLNVTDVKALSLLLDEMNMEYDILSENRADIYGDIDITEFTVALAQRGCRINSLHEKNETLESYFINLVGGEDND